MANANAANAVEKPSSKLETLRAAKEKRAEGRAKEFEKLEVEALELEEKYETSGLKFGVDFNVETTAIGNFVVRKPEFLVAKKFADAATKSVEEVTQFVAPCVIFPEQMEARMAFQEHGGIAWKLAAVLMKLYEADVGAVRGK